MTTKRMSIDVDEKTHEQFTTACHANNTTPTATLREFMHLYTKKHYRSAPLGSLSPMELYLYTQDISETEALHSLDTALNKPNESTS